jgi:hypothetical protein
VRQADGQLIADHPTEPTHWSLDALVSAAHQQGIAIKRSQVRRILLERRRALAPGAFLGLKQGS